jgi:hypothetical protein
MAIEGNAPQPQDQDLAPERTEPDLTPAPGTQRASDSDGTDKNEPGFDPDSPDLADPQIDPVRPATPPSGAVDKADKRAKGDSYPPYDNGGQQG